MKVLLTGAAGNLGVCVFRRLLEAGYDVVGTDIRCAEDTPKPCVLADLLDPQAVEPLVRGCDALVHAGNHPTIRDGTSPMQTYLENVTMNTHVFQAAENAGIRCIVFASSIQVISGNRHVANLDEPSCLNRLPLDSQAPPRPGNMYALSKVAGEQNLRYQAFLYPDGSYTAIRLPALIGDRRDGHARPSSLRRPGWLTKADEAYAYLTKADAADLIHIVIEKRLHGYHQYLPVAGNILGLSTEQMVRKFYPDVPISEGHRPLTSLFDLSTIQSELGWSPKEVDLFSLTAEPS